MGGAFVDWNHYHPWATIDTLMLMPLMETGGFIGHNALNLYMHKDYRDQLGPKYLFDQLPKSIRFKDREQPFAGSFLMKRASRISNADEKHDRIPPEHAVVE